MCIRSTMMGRDDKICATIGIGGEDFFLCANKRIADCVEKFVFGFLFKLCKT